MEIWNYINIEIKCPDNLIHENIRKLHSFVLYLTVIGHNI